MTDLKITVEQEKITPAKAKKYLEKNHPKNRPIQWGRVAAFEKDILAGAWALIHQGICFDAEGFLIDGQHRLHAIARSGVAVDMVVAHNMAGQFEAPIDRGQPRSMSLISGKSRRILASLNILRQLEQGFSDNTPFTLNDVNEYFARHEEAIDRLQQIPSYTRLMGGTAAAIVWALPVNEDAVAQWATQVLTGEMLKRGQPAYTFRRWLESSRQARSGNWNQTMTALNCLRYHLVGLTMQAVSTGESGYRAITSQRRKMKVPNTPGTDLVISMSMKPTRGEVAE